MRFAQKGDRSLHRVRSHCFLSKWTVLKVTNNQWSLLFFLLQQLIARCLNFSCTGTKHYNGNPRDAGPARNEPENTIRHLKQVLRNGDVVRGYALLLISPSHYSCFPQGVLGWRFVLHSVPVVVLSVVSRRLPR